MTETNGPLHRLESWVCASQRLVDVLLIIGAQVLAHTLFPEPWSDQTTTVTVIALLVFGFSAELSGLYRPWRTGTVLREAKDAVLAWLAVPTILFAFWFFTKTATHYSRVASFAWFVFAPLLLCAMRIGIRSVLRVLRIQGRNVRRVAILGYTKDAERLAQSFEAMPWLGLRLLGVYDDRSKERRHEDNPPRFEVIGRSDDLIQACHQGQIDAVYVALPLRAEERTARILAALADTTVTVYLVADLLYFSLLRAQWGQVGDVPIVSLHDSPFRGIVGWIKRIEDLVLGSLIVVFTALPMICIALAIKLKTPMWKEDSHLEVQNHDRLRGRAECGPGHAGRCACHGAGQVLATHLSRRISTVSASFDRRALSRRAAAARGGAQREIPRNHPRLHAQAHRQAWNHGLGTSQWMAR